jgi:general secretion pathway protein L
MSTLIIQLPSQPRLAARQEAAAPSGPATEFNFVLQRPGAEPDSVGRALASALPQAQHCVAVVPAADIAWHRLVLPKAPSTRMRQALSGLLEESLLEDESELHLALRSGSKSGESGWVAAINKSWLKSLIALLEQAGHDIDRVVPAWAPDGEPAARVFSDEHGLQLAWRDADGPLCVPLSSATAKALARGESAAAVTWAACPEGAEPAANVAGSPVAALEPQALLRDSLLSAWNLRQFDLAPQRRGQRAAQEWLQQFLQDRAWRPLRWGLVALLLIQLLGGNLWAWQQRRALEQRKQAMNALLQATFPKVRGIIDAPVQMRKEVDALRAAAGKPGDTDLETLLYAAQTAWPEAKGNADGFVYESGRLTLNSAGWVGSDLEAFRSGLRPWGLGAEASDAGPIVMRPPGGPQALSAAPTPAALKAPVESPTGQAEGTQ